MTKKAAEAKPNQVLRAARKEHGWTQQEVADQIGAPLALNVTRWERGTAVPSPHYTQQLCQLFGKTPLELGLLTAEDSRRQIPPLAATRYWNVPYRRNPFFTGRETMLATLHQHFSLRPAAAISQSSALSGLGGIGKTQLAIEYAYRYRDEYHAIFWVRAASRQTLIADYVALAKLVELPGSDAQDQMQMVAAAKRWLAHHQGWLLILDNAEEVSVVLDFLPESRSGHVLLTTRSQATGQIAPSLCVDKMEPQEACLLLLHRAKRLALGASLDAAPPQARAAALAIVHELDGLPLALDQAGAYMEETGCGLEEYLDHYRRHRMRLLQRPSVISSEYPHTVASTWSLSFQQVEQANPAAAELLRLLAFLDPDAIPEALLTEGAQMLGPVLAPVASEPFLLNEALQVLRGYSLVRRNPQTHTLSLHRLVQEVLKEGMEETTRQHWVERVVKMLNAVFPEVSFGNWPRCQQCLPHVNRCADLLKQYPIASPEAGRLLTYAGWYLCESGQYTQAEVLLQQGLTIREEVLGSKHPDVAATLDILGYLYPFQGDYVQAEAMLQRALAIREEVQGPDHPDIATTLYYLEWLGCLQGQYERGKLLAQRALAIREKTCGPEHPKTGDIVSDLAAICLYQGLYAEAEPLYQRSLLIFERVYGPVHPDIARMSNGLGLLYNILGRYEEAEQLFERAVTMSEHTLGPEHGDTAMILDNAGRNALLQGKYVQAEAFLRRALQIYELIGGHEGIETAFVHLDLAHLFCQQGEHAQAEALCLQSQSTLKQKLRPEHPRLAKAQAIEARIYEAQGRYQEACALYQEAIAIREKALGPEHPETLALTKDYARLIQTASTGVGREEEQQWRQDESKNGKPYGECEAEHHDTRRA